MIICPSCNTSNEDGTKFCVSCGTPFVTDAPPAENTVTCPTCATVNPPGVQFCVSCGTPLNPAFMHAGQQATLVSAGPAPTASLEDLGAAAPPQWSSDETMLASRPSAPPASPPDAALLASPALAASGDAPAAPPPMAAPAAGARKERSVALLLEILPALVGVFGIGWIYSGNLTPGVVLLVAMLVWEALGFVVALFTLGLGCLCFIPINLVVIAVSSYLLYNHTKQHPEVFGA